MSFPKTVILGITCHGNIIVNKENNEPMLYKIPDDMKIVKLSAVTIGVCNLTISEDIDKFIKTILYDLQKNKKKINKILKTNPESYVKSVADLYQTIETETVQNTMMDTSQDSNTQLRNDYIHHRNKSYKIVTYDKSHPYIINKEYIRNDATEQNSSEWDYGIYCLNVEGKPDLITKIKGRSYMEKNTSIFLEDIVDYLRKNGVKEIILLDMTCSSYEYENSTTSVDDRTSRKIRLNMIKKTLNGGKKPLKNKTNKKRFKRRLTRHRTRS
jgi:hypothetical protein